MKFKDLLPIIFIGIFAVLLIIMLFITNKKYNTESHSEDVLMTEWVSPDGVHYWYQRAGYHSMLAPRYDSEGNLVINK